MSDIVIEAKQLQCHFGDTRERKEGEKPAKKPGVKAVDGIDFRIARGEIFGLLGPNGAGKTTTLSMLVTIRKPTGGAALVAGIDVAQRPGEVRRKVGIVFQEPSLDTLLTARENLELHGRLYGVPPSELRARTDEMLKLVGLESRANDQVKKFSGGMKRRLEIGRGLMHRPEILFLDEPTLGLDPATRERICEHIRELRDTRGTTVVLTTHYMEEADSLCDRVAIIDHGKIVALDTPAALKKQLGGDLVTLTGVTADARKQIEALSFVKKVEEKGPALLLTVENAGMNLPRIVALAGDVKNIEVRTARLEDVFLSLTGRGLRDETEAGEDYFDQYVRTQAGGE